MQKYPIKATYIDLRGRTNVMLWQPTVPTPNSEIAIVCMHGGNSKTLNNSPQIALAERGFQTIYGVPYHSDYPSQYLDLKATIDFAYNLPGVKKVILSGSSRGAALASSYQRIAEHGISEFQGPDRLLSFPNLGTELTPVDGIMLLDANFGFMNMLGVNPALIEEGNAVKMDPALDALNPENGFNPNGSSNYTEEFRKKFCAAQTKRYRNLLAMARERLDLIEKGEGNYVDNEPFDIPEAYGALMNSKLFSLDTKYFAHTEKEYPLVHPDGSVTTEIIHCVRLPRAQVEAKSTYGFASWKTTVRDFLYSEIKLDDDWGFDETSFWGVDWDSCFSCSTGNVKRISIPILLMGFTGGYEYLAAAYNYEAAASADKTIAFTEGAAHSWLTCTEAEKFPGQYGDTLQTTCDYVTKWILRPGRFTGITK